jgi:Ni,Fe-hydrogenase I cytochrome b subunit
MYKRVFFHALLSAALAAIAGIIYYRIYFFATEADFSRILNPLSITAMSIFVCMIASFIYIGLVKWLDRKGEIIFNFLFSIASFACVMVPISISLPLDIKFPELFPGLAVPMVFFPALAWMTARPLFARK